MITIKSFVFNPFQENTYVLFDETNECVIVDAGCHSPEEQRELTDFIQKNNLKPVLAINTHGHVDHILGNAFVKKTYKINIAASPEDLTLIQTASQHALTYGFTIEDAPLIDRNLNDGDEITFGNSKLKVLHTPGHSMGGICFLNAEEGFVLSGDTLFQGSIGRTDLPGGNYAQLINSIKTKLLNLAPNTKVYTGHGEPSTIEWEKENNPFLS